MLNHFGLPATIFLVTDVIDSDKHVWFTRLHDAIARATIPHWQGYDLTTSAARSQTSARLQAALKRLDHRELLAKLDEICAALGPSNSSPLPEDSPFRILTSAQIKKMASSGSITFGAHTTDHGILQRRPSNEARDSIFRSVEGVANLIGDNCTMFAYPNGQLGDYGKESLAALREAGITIAVTARLGPNINNTSPLELRRVGSGSWQHSDEDSFLFEAKVHHLPWWVHKLRYDEATLHSRN